MYLKMMPSYVLDLTDSVQCHIKCYVAVQAACITLHIPQVLS